MKANRVVLCKYETFAYLYIDDKFIDIFNIFQPGPYLGKWLEEEYGYRLGYKMESNGNIVWDIHKLSP